MRYRIPTSSAIAYPKPRRVKRKVARAQTPEAALQGICEEYLDALGLRWLHIPKGALTICSWQSGAHIAAKREVADYLKGVPDLLVFGPRMAQDYPRCLLVELKVGKNKRTEAQLRWAAATVVHEVRDFDRFRELVDKLVRKCAEDI